MRIHKKTRQILSTLSLPSPIKKYFSSDVWDLDLTNNTNPYLGYLADYPDVKHQDLKEIYIDRLLSINPPLHFRKNEFSALSSENILFTAGSMEGIDLLLRTLGEPNKDVICIAHPTFSAYEHWALLHNLKVKKIPFLGENFESISVKEILKINPKMVFVCDPNNPTGTKLHPEVIEKLCESLNGFVVIDEAYIEFSDSSSFVFHFHKYNNLIILRTLSKAWGLAGIRCGAIIAEKSVIHALRHVQLPFGFSSFSQVKVKERLVDTEETFLSWQRIKKNRDVLSEQLSTLEEVTKVFKSHTNFVLLTLKNFQGGMEFLKEHKILVLDCSSNLSNSIRVSIGNEEQMARFLEVMQNAPFFLKGKMPPILL